MENLMSDINMLRGLFFEGLRKSSEEKKQQTSVPTEKAAPFIMTNKYSASKLDIEEPQ